MADVDKCAAPSGDWPNNKDDYELGEVIGVGSIAIVHIAECKPRKEKCAIKRIRLETWIVENEELKQAEALFSCNNKNVVNYFTSFIVGEELWLIMKLLEGGSLSDIILNYTLVKKCEDGVFDEEVIATVLRKVLKGLSYLHERGQLHNDIKTENILISKSGNVQISGCGLSAWLLINCTSQEKSHSLILRKQCLMGTQVDETTVAYDFKADIWRIGLVAIEMATGRSPYHRYYRLKSMLPTLSSPFTVESAGREMLQYKKYGKQFKHMLNSCFQMDPQKRPTAAQLLKHPFFKKAKKSNFLERTLSQFQLPPYPRVLRVMYRTKFPETNGWRYQAESEDWIWLPREERNN